MVTPIFSLLFLPLILLKDRRPSLGKSGLFSEAECVETYLKYVLYLHDLSMLVFL